MVLFDHHTDMLPSPSEELISCGSWVLKALERLPALRKVILIGVNELWQEQIPQAFQHKLSIFAEHTSPPPQTIIDAIPTENIYISIDKDVLAMSEARTNWDHGSLSLKDLLLMTKNFSHQKHLLGVDVCGEYPFTPQTAQHTVTKIALQKNDLANWHILNACQKQKAPLHLMTC
ncbi:arginase family protein [Virgibacillus halophilus]|uniref:Arginase family protein n=1 Tax=Tigheibacillus halophilus TaxID=361280 RepID=A0ABU5C7B8_9BACI|nr:arginase family protein [Virgibacillus halophilus]